MSQTLTISDDLFSRLEADARQRGFILETWQGAEADLERFRRLVQRW